MNKSSIKDWELSLVYGSVFGDLNVSGNIYLISLGKKIGRHYFYGRYTPAIQQSFVFNSGVRIEDNSSSGIETELKEKIVYEEKFGLGYSFDITEKFSFGFTVRYFQQRYTRDILIPFFSDSLNYIKSENETIDKKFWRGDVGFLFSPFEHFALSVSSINLLNIKEEEENTGSKYDLRSDKGAAFGLAIYDLSGFNIYAAYETTQNFTAGFNKTFETGIGSFGIGLSAMHDKTRNNFISAVVPAFNYSTNFIGLSITGVKYTGGRAGSNSLTQFQTEGISNILNNRYSTDMLFVSFNIALSFLPGKLVDLIDVDIVNDIYPAMPDEYIDTPFAIGRAANLSDKPVIVKPSSFIEGINEEMIISPEVTLAPFDTVDIPFYTVLENISAADRRRIMPANFYVTTINSSPDDEIQKPVLINDANSWDGRVNNLRYFVKHDYNYMNRFAKEIINENKIKISEALPELETFTVIKILFDEFSSGMSYVADPRSSVDRVQYPSETIDLKGGDCDDLAVCFSSMLESVGIQTAFVDYKSDEGISHVNLLINTNLIPEQSALIAFNAKKYFIRKKAAGGEEIWIPLETTLLKSFDDSWENASENFYLKAVEQYGLAKGIIEIVDVY